jgi:hypothetical protein
VAVHPVAKVGLHIHFRNRLLGLTCRIDGDALYFASGHRLFTRFEGDRIAACQEILRAIAPKKALS